VISELNFVNNVCNDLSISNFDTINVSHDLVKWVINDVTREYMAKQGINQNIDSDFKCSKRNYSDKYRFLN